MGPEGHFGEVRELFDGKVVKGAPYSAQVTTEVVQTLADGNKITRQMTSSLYRDSDGRTRREQTLGSVGPFMASHGSPRVFVSDPVAGTRFVLSPTKKEAIMFPQPPARNGDGPRQHGGHGNGPKTGAPERQTENLGKQTIAGIEAEGTRTTVTLPAGAIGNEAPIQIVSERWYAPTLQTVILRKHSDPRFGDTTTTWTGIKTAEPDHSLFVVPSDYTVKDAPSRFNKNLNPPQPPAN
jgi:hypothetical protein